MKRGEKMLRIKECIICGKPFETKRSNKKYCSLVCKDAAIKKKRLEWKMDNPNYYTEYMRERRKKECQE